MYDFEVPIVMEILPVFRIEDAVARTKGEQNKGIEAGLATIDIVLLNRKIVEAGVLAGCN
jgi:6,7-dimethyl-8-ribityllumazine synthase